MFIYRERRLSIYISRFKHPLSLNAGDEHSPKTWCNSLHMA